MNSDQNHISAKDIPDFHEKLRGMVYGAAVGDALGVPYEFKMRWTFECTGMVGHGTHFQPAGTFSDDTSMLLATLDSLMACGWELDEDDMRERFLNWVNNGAYTPDGDVFDIGGATARALHQGHGVSGERDNGNGSLMRIAPLAFTDLPDEDISAASAITHAHQISTSTCVAFVHIARKLLRGTDAEAAIAACAPYPEWLERIEGIGSLRESAIKSGGYVVHTMEAALWCLLNTDSYASCVLQAVNMGGDTDTTACVAGALAGIVYGYDAIPEEWLETLRGKEVIEAVLATA